MLRLSVTCHLVRAYTLYGILMAEFLTAVAVTKYRSRNNNFVVTIDLPFSTRFRSLLYTPSSHWETIREMDSGFWHVAANSLDAKIKDQIWKIVNEPCGPTDLLASVKASQQRCRENRWTLYTKPNGHKIYFRDVFSKM